MADERKMVNIRLDTELWRNAKARAAIDGKTLQEWIEDAIKARLEWEPEPVVQIQMAKPVIQIQGIKKGGRHGKL